MDYHQFLMNGSDSNQSHDSEESELSSVILCAIVVLYIIAGCAVPFIVDFMYRMEEAKNKLTNGSKDESSRHTYQLLFNTVINFIVRQDTTSQQSM